MTPSTQVSASSRPQQSVFTCCATIAPGQYEPLVEKLADLQAMQAARANPHGLADVPGLHCARLFAVAPGRDADGHYLPPSLVLSTWYDGAYGAHLRWLSQRATTLLDSTFEHCDGYRSSFTKPALVRDFLERRSLPTLASFNGAPSKTVDDIRLESPPLRASAERPRLLPRDGSGADCRRTSPGGARGSGASVPSSATDRRRAR